MSKGTKESNIKALADQLRETCAIATDDDTVYASDGAGFKLAATYDKGRFTDAENGNLLGSTHSKALGVLEDHGRKPRKNGDRHRAKAEVKELKKNTKRNGRAPAKGARKERTDSH